MISLKNSHQKQKGFTLIEIMIALTIGIFLAAGVAQVFIGTKQTNRMQENLSRMQENARFAMYFLTQEIRQADFEGNVCGNKKLLETAYNNLDSSAAMYHFNSSDAIVGFDSFGLNGSDKITVKRAIVSGQGTSIVLPHNNNNANLKVESNVGSFAQGDIVLVTNCSRGDIFQIINTTGTGGTTLTHSVGNNNQPGNKTNNLSAEYTGPAKVYRFSVRTAEYTIKEDSFGVPGLMLNNGVITQQLVPNIENMQILYGQRQGGVMFYVPAETAGLDMAQVISIRVSLLARSPDDFVATNPQAYFYNGVDVSGAAIPDRRLRKVYTSTIAVRNRLN